MDTLYLLKAIKQKPLMNKHFGGIYCRDTLPKNIPKRERPFFYICNTDVSSGPGKHWVTLYYPKHGQPEFFDSLGHSPRHYGFKGHYKYKTRAIQSPTSILCAKFALYYALQRLRGFSSDNISNQFLRKHLWFNDKIVNRMFPI
jgi:hypothetical protein